MIGLLSFNFGWAQTYTVTTTAFDATWWVASFTPNSLSDALNEANQGNINKIVFDLPDNSTIQTGASDWTYKILTASGIEINGWGNNNLTIAGSGESPALIMRGDDLKVKNLQFTTTAATRGGLEYQTNNSLVDSCTFINGNLYVGHIQQPAVYVQGNIIRNCDIQNGNLQIMGADNQVLNSTILGQLIIGHQGTNVLSNNNEIIDCTGMAQGSTIYGNENEITNAQINVTQILPNGDNPAAGINIIGSKNIIKTSTISNTLTVNNAKATEGIRLSGAASFDNVIDSININGYWNGVYITDNAKQNTISNNKMNKSINMGIYLYDNANDNTLINNVIDDVEIGNGIYIRLSEGNTASKNTVTNVKLGNGFSIYETTGKNTIDSNVVYSNVGAGVLVANALNTEVTNNFIGQDSTGTIIGGNANGVSISEGGSGNIIKANTIVANLNGGIVIDNSSNNTIVSNLIGDVTKSNSALENSGNGILAQNGASNNIIGKSGEGNTIQNKTKTFAAIQVDGTSSTGNTIQGNILSCNAGKGIELSNGGNQEYSSKGDPNWVTINNAEPTVDVISGKFQTVTTGTVRIDFYMTGDCNTRCSSDETGNITQNELAQGKTWITSQSFDATIGEWSYTLTAADTTAGLTIDNVIVTATDGAGNTSEFAVCEFDPPCTKPTLVDLTSDNAAVCNGASITMTAKATPSNSTNNVFEWYKNDTLLSTTATTLTIDKITDNGTYKVFVYDLDKNLCGLNSNDLAVKINDNPTDPTFTDNAKELCQGTGNSTVSVTEVAGMKYQWTADNIVSGQNTKEITVDFTTATNPTVIKVKAIDIATGCESTEITTNVTINDNPKPVINGDAAPLCNAAGVIYNVVNADTSSNYVWTIPTGATQVGDKSLNNDTITVDYSDSNGNITVTETNSKGCVGTSDDFAIALKSCGLKANFSFDNADLCVESSLQKNNVTFTDQSTGDDIVLYVWDFGTDATPSTQGTQGPHTVQYATTGKKYITLTITDNVGTESKYIDSVVVNDVPNTNDFMIEGDGGCENTTTSFEVKENNGSGVDLSLYDYDWSNTPDAITNGQGSTKVDVLLGSDQNGTVKVKIADKTTTCQIEQSKDYDITVQPDFNLSITGNDTICDGFSQFSEFENKTSYTYNLSKSLSEIHPQTDSVFIYWTLTDKDGNVTTLEEDGQQGSYSGDDDTTNTKQTQVIIKPGYITKEEFKDYSLSVVISKRGACADSTTTPLNRSIKINKSHEYKFSVKDVLVCEDESPEFNAQLMIDGRDTTYTQTWWEYVHNWSYIDADKTPSEEVTTPNLIIVTDFITGEITDTLYKYKDTNPYKVGENDSLFLTVDSDKFCYKKESIFNDTLVDFTVRRPAGIIGLGTQDKTPDTTELIIQDVEEIKLKDLNSLNNINNTKWEWTWKMGDNFVSDSIDDPAAIATSHNPRAIKEIIYRLVTNNGTCTDTVYAKLTNLLLPFVPNAVSPNGDGVFDSWVIHNSDNYPDMTVQVFNRWGSLVYESEKGYPVNWTGTRSNGEDLPTGTYFYVINFNNEIVDTFAEDETENPYSTARNKEASLKAGSITIMR